jgi:hypothetical protein
LQHMQNPSGLCVQGRRLPALFAVSVQGENEVRPTQTV